MEWLTTLPDGCADLVLTDPPYGTTNCDWDTKVDMVALFAELWRVLKHNGAVLVFGQFPMVFDVWNAARKEFRYDLVYEKGRALGFLNAKKMPLRKHENILVFYRALPTYNPQMTQGKPYHKKAYNPSTHNRGNIYGKKDKYMAGEKRSDGARYPTSIIRAASVNYGIHPTQKPQGLCEMLIRQYTQPGELVVDPFAGSGTTAAAARATGRHFLSCEMDAGYHAKAVERVAGVCPPLPGTEPLGVPELRRLAAERLKQ